MRLIDADALIRRVEHGPFDRFDNAFRGWYSASSVIEAIISTPTVTVEEFVRYAKRENHDEE